MGVSRVQLVYGLTGDYIEVAHILMPQIENSLRVLIQRAAGITQHLSADGIQEEKTLGPLLEKEELRTILGDDLVFDLKCLLSHEYGEQLRHGVAHGLYNQNSFFSVEVIYLWWLILHIIYRFKKAQLMAQDEEPGESPELPK